MTQLSKNFTLEELTNSITASKRGLSNVPLPTHQDNLKNLVEAVLQPLRDILGVGIKITSGYRGFALNQAIGGSKSSQHCEGKAADFTVVGKSSTEICKIIIASGIEFDQLIDELTWVHVSYNQGKNRKEVLTADFSGGKVKYHKGLIHDK